MTRPMPRLFVVRHVLEQERLNGLKMDIPLTTTGEAKVKILAEQLVGPGLPVDRKNLGSIIVSPRRRAYRTFELLFSANGEAVDLPDHTVTEEIGEWHYGDYEGLTPAEIKKLKPTWSVWKDGCPGGETVSEMEKRVDSTIQKIRAHHKAYLANETDGRDVLLIAHGHFNRVLMARWLNFPLCLGTHFNVGPGSCSVLGYNHGSLDEPALNALNLFATIQ